MPKPASKHPGTPEHGRPGSPKVHKERVNFYVDLATVKILDDLVEAMPEIENRSAAVRYLAREHGTTRRRKAGPS
jgi:hypothetical protein